MLDVPCERYNFTYELPEREIIVYADRRRIEQVLEKFNQQCKKICMRKRKHSFSRKAGKFDNLFFCFQSGKHYSRTGDLPNLVKVLSGEMDGTKW